MKEKYIQRIQELYAKDYIALRCEREELGYKAFAIKYNIQFDTIRKYCPLLAGRYNRINNHLMRGATYEELRKMGYTDGYIVKNMNKFREKNHRKPISSMPVIPDPESPRPVHREYIPYWMDDSVVDPDRPLRCEKTKNIR